MNGWKMILIYLMNVKIGIITNQNGGGLTLRIRRSFIEIQKKLLR